MVLFAVYIGFKIGQNREQAANADDNYNDIEPIQYQEVEKEVGESSVDEDLMNNKYFKVLLMPLTVMFDITMPSNKSPIIKFFTSIGWLSALSYFSVNAITDLSE